MPRRGPARLPTPPRISVVSQVLVADNRARPRRCNGTARPGEYDQGAHVRASRARSGAFGVPAQRPRGVLGAAPSEYRRVAQLVRAPA